MLTGTFKSSVVVRGACEVNAGAAVVNGDLTVSPGSVLLAAFALNDKTGTGKSSLTVKGNIYVRAGATLLMGCNPANFACLDDPNQNKPTLSMHPTVGLDLRSNLPLGVIVHNFTVGGDVIQTGGGGGVNCNPQGVFKLFGSPVYSTYEVGSVGGDVRISSVQSCWMGIVELHIGNTMVMHANKLADPDAIEILANNITGNLICRGNSRTWNSEDISNGLFPRKALAEHGRPEPEGPVRAVQPDQAGRPARPRAVLTRAACDRVALATDSRSQRHGHVCGRVRWRCRGRARSSG